MRPAFPTPTDATPANLLVTLKSCASASPRESSLDFHGGPLDLTKRAGKATRLVSLARPNPCVSLFRLLHGGLAQLDAQALLAQPRDHGVGPVEARRDQQRVVRPALEPHHHFPLG